MSYDKDKTLRHLYNFILLGNSAAPTQGYFPQKGQNNNYVAPTPTQATNYQPPSSQDSYGSPLAKPVSNYGTPAQKPPAPVGAPSYVRR